MNQVDVVGQVSRDGVCEGTDALVSRIEVLERGELGVQKVIGFINGDAEREPVSGLRERLRRQAVLGQPLVHSSHRFWFGSHESIDLPPKP